MRVLCALLGVALLFPVATKAADGRSLVFDLYRKDKKVGSHTLRFSQADDVLTVDIAIDIKGKVLFIPFTYRHTNKEQWRGSQLLALDSRTYINDKAHILSARFNSGGYDVSHDKDKTRIEGAIKTTSYWHPATGTQARLLNTQNGKVIPITFSAPQPVQAPMATGGTLTAREIRMSDKKKFNANVAYDAQGCLVGINFKPPFDGTQIIYRLVARPNAKDAPDLLRNPLIAKCVSQTGSIATTPTLSSGGS